MGYSPRTISSEHFSLIADLLGMPTMVRVAYKAQSYPDLEVRSRVIVGPNIRLATETPIAAVWGDISVSELKRLYESSIVQQLQAETRTPLPEVYFRAARWDSDTKDGHAPAVVLTGHELHIKEAVANNFGQLVDLLKREGEIPRKFYPPHSIAQNPEIWEHIWTNEI